MSKKLSDKEREHFAEHGYLFPINVFSPDEIGRYQKALEDTERAVGPIREREKSGKPHLLFPWANQLMREPKVLDVIEDLVGPDIFVYQVTFFSKDAHSDTFVSWHQDGTYFSLYPHEQITAWIALSDAPIESGCLEVLPGSQRMGQLRHVEATSKSNLLSRGQTVAEEVNSSGSVFMPLVPGQMSLHHTHMLHRSGPNTTPNRRMGLVVTYIPGRCRCVEDIRMTASLVRGEDKFKQFDPEYIPQSNLDERGLVFHKESNRRFSILREINAKRMQASS